MTSGSRPPVAPDAGRAPARGDGWDESGMGKSCSTAGLWGFRTSGLSIHQKYFVLNTGSRCLLAGQSGDATYSSHMTLILHDACHRRERINSVSRVAMASWVGA